MIRAKTLIIESLQRVMPKYMVDLVFTFYHFPLFVDTWKELHKIDATLLGTSHEALVALRRVRGNTTVIKYSPDFSKVEDTAYVRTICEDLFSETSISRFDEHLLASTWYDFGSTLHRAVESTSEYFRPPDASHTYQQIWGYSWAPVFALNRWTFFDATVSGNLRFRSVLRFYVTPPSRWRNIFTPIKGSSFQGNRVFIWGNYSVEVIKAQEVFSPRLHQHISLGYESPKHTNTFQSCFVSEFYTEFLSEIFTCFVIQQNFVIIFTCGQIAFYQFKNGFDGPFIRSQMELPLGSPVVGVYRINSIKKNYLLVARESGYIWVIDVSTQDVLQTFQVEFQIHSVVLLREQLLPYCSYIAVLNTNYQKILIFSLWNGEEEAEWLLQVK